MTYIKKLVMHGFKSFANRTEIPFDKTMNVVVGPNGCGKSNVADALCFVLGRLSIKSIRAAKAANLLFSGTKQHKPAYEAFVELVFDNSDSTFPVQANEISIKRVLRKNGQSIYKINHETKTRQELLELLAQAGIDPNGYNIVLQGGISDLIKMNGEGRRKIIEDVAGISVYEHRKQRSLHELERTEEKLKEVGAVLREKKNYLAQLERDKQEAQKYQKYEEQIKRGKATICIKNINQKEEEIKQIDSGIEEKKEEIEKLKKDVSLMKKEVDILSFEVKQIDKLIENSTNAEQGKIHQEIANLRSEIASSETRRDNFAARMKNASDKKKQNEDKIISLESDLKELSKNSPLIKKQQEKMSEYRKKSEELEKKRRKFYALKSGLSSLEGKREERQKDLIEIKKELELFERSINNLYGEIKFEKFSEKANLLKDSVSGEIESLRKKAFILAKEILDSEKNKAIFENNLAEEEKLKRDIIKLDVCPLCKSSITKEHITHVLEDSNKKIEEIRRHEGKRREEIEEKIGEEKKLKEKIEELSLKEREIEIDIINLKNADSRKEEAKQLVEEQKKKQKELQELDKQIIDLKKDIEPLKNIEQEYDENKLTIDDLTLPEIDADSEVTVKQRELNRLRMEIQSFLRDSEESEKEYKANVERIDNFERHLQLKEEEEADIYNKFQSLFARKNSLQDRQKGIETQVIGLEHTINTKQDKINDLNVYKARISAEIEGIRFEFHEFESFEAFPCSIDEAKRKVEEAQQKLIQIGSVNLRALEVYEQVKEQVVAIEEKTETILHEKENIMKIIEEIDKKKRKSFLQTLEKVNELFTRNFSQLSRKGEVFLELENNENPFEAGLNILVKVAKGKYFDINSLSGGEKTLVALSLIFAIQEYHPFSFYIFDEIDAALDKRNSELLAALVRRYILSGQYIIITHNDAIITEAQVLYGVTMQEGLSKIISIKLGEHEKFIEKKPEVVEEKKEEKIN